MSYGDEKNIRAAIEQVLTFPDRSTFLSDGLQITKGARRILRVSDVIQPIAAVSVNGHVRIPRIHPEPNQVVAADPAAGSEFSGSPPDNFAWILLAVQATLVADATVANRDARLIIDGGGEDAIVFAHSGVLSQTAGLTQRHVWTMGSAVPTTVPTLFAAGLLHTAAVQHVSSLPYPIWLVPGYRVRSLTTNLQAGDNWGAPTLIVEEYDDVWGVRQVR